MILRTLGLSLGARPPAAPVAEITGEVVNEVATLSVIASSSSREKIMAVAHDGKDLVQVLHAVDGIGIKQH
jgi:hypothetical protein